MIDFKNIFQRRGKKLYNEVSKKLERDLLRSNDKALQIEVEISAINKNFFDNVFTDINNLMGIKFDIIESGRKNIFILCNFKRCKKTNQLTIPYQ